MLLHERVDHPHVTTRRSMAYRLWDLDWQALLPLRFDDVRVEYGTLEEVQPFMAKLYPETFNVERQWLQEPSSEAKRRFGEEMDVFVFRTDEQIVGVLAGHPTDWSTYYWRTAAFLPEHRGRNLLSSFCDWCVKPLRECGVQRMDLDTCPANRAMVQFATNNGFIATATSSSERWGLSLRFTRFLVEEAKRVYAKQFLDVPHNPTTERSRP